MKMKSVAIFLPVRKGSQRVIKKNTRKFADFKYGLLELKLNQLSQIKNIEEIIISTNDEECKEIVKKSRIDKRIKLDDRPDYLGLDTTSLQDLVAYVPNLTKCEHILWTHVTSPFLDNLDYENAIEQYFSALMNGNDSLMSVTSFKNFLWSKENKDIINRKNNEKWPRTQDLKELWEIDSGIFIASRDIYIKEVDRIGKSPFLFENDKLKGFDIDWEIDFQIAETIYQKIQISKNV